MRKNRVILGLGLTALLVVASALAFVAGGGTSARIARSGDTELLVPPMMSTSAGWKAAPVAGAPAALPWANLRVNTDGSTEAQNEPFVAINPSNSRHMVVGANNWLAGNGRFEVYAYVTFDGGQSWHTSVPYIDRNGSRLNAADPTVAFGPNGEVYFAFVAMTPAQGAVAVSRSLDGGLTWASQSWATPFTAAADKPAMAAGNGKLYLVYQNGNLLSRVSADGGASWSGATLIEAGGRNGYPVAHKDGVHVFYATNSSIKVANSYNGGASYTLGTVSNAVALQPRRTNYRATIYPAAGVDAKGTFYVAWADGRNAGRGNDILFSRSANGSSWSAPVALNTDAGNSDQLMPALAVGSDGAVNVAWLDNRNDANNYNYDVYMARSVNGGRNFGPNMRVTNISSNPDNDPRTEGTMIGDYFAMAAGNGVAYPFWADTRNNNQDIYMAPVPFNSVND
jgi:hypothetical protein